MIQNLLIHLLFLQLTTIYYSKSSPCQMSPITRYLTEDQQKTLHNIIVISRNAGEDEKRVKESMDEYLSEILPTDKLIQLKREHDQFELNRRGRRSVGYGKKEPQRVFDIVDEITNYYDRYYDEELLNRNRNKI